MIWILMILPLLAWLIFSIPDEPGFGRIRKRKRSPFRLLPLCLFALPAKAQTGIYAWTGIVNASKIHTWKENGYHGVRIIVPWWSLQITEANLSFANLKNVIKQVSDSGLNMEIHVWAGPDAPIFGATDWLADLGVETFMTTGHSEGGPWPNYYNPVYMSAYLTLHEALADTLYNLPSDQKEHVKSVFISSGHTGDPQPYKGEPIGTTYGIIDDVTWDDYCNQQWLDAYQFYRKDTLFMRNSFNAKNDAENLEFIFDNMPDAYIKHGDRSHEYPLLGETFMFDWPRKVYFGEIDDVVKESRFRGDHMQIIRSALSLFTPRLDFKEEWDTLAWVTDLVDFFHKYNEEFDPLTATKGFCAIAGKPDHLNTTEFPETPYGTRWNSLNSYTSQYNAILASSFPPLYKEIRLAKLASNMHNATRRNNIMAATGALYNPVFGPYYNNDYSFYVKNNYELNLRQMLVTQTTQFVYRPDLNSLYGRNGGIPKAYEGATALYFDINDSLIVSANSDTLEVTVTYKDVGTTTWELQYYNCGKIQCTNTNTGLYKQTTFTIPNFKKGNLMRYDADLIIEIKSGAPFIIDMVEVENLSK